MNTMKLISAIAAGSLLSVGIAHGASVSISGTPSNLSFTGTSSDFQPTGLTAQQTVTFDKIELAPNEDVNEVVITVGSDFSVSVDVTNNSANNAIFNFSGEAIQTATAPSSSDQLSDPNATLNVSSPTDGILSGETKNFSGSVSGLVLRVDLDPVDFIATGPGQTVDVVISAVFNVTSTSLLSFTPPFTFGPADPSDFIFDWNFFKNDVNIQAVAEVTSTAVPVPSSVIIFALGLAGLGFRLRKLSA